MLMNDKIMIDRYYCINSTKHCENVNTCPLIACGTGIYAIIYIYINPKYHIFPFYKMYSESTSLRKAKEKYFINTLKPKLNRAC